MGQLEVAYCIVCEDLRQELYNKVSILGFYGLTPNIDIKVKELNKPLSRLMFLFSIKGEITNPELKLIINNPDNSALAAAQITLNNNGNVEKALVGIAITDLIFQHTGDYILQLYSGETEIYNSTFNVDIADPSIFK